MLTRQQGDSTLSMLFEKGTKDTIESGYTDFILEFQVTVVHDGKKQHKMPWRQHRHSEHNSMSEAAGIIAVSSFK